MEAEEETDEAERAVFDGCEFADGAGDGGGEEGGGGVGGERGGQGGVSGIFGLLIC